MHECFRIPIGPHTARSVLSRNAYVVACISLDSQCVPYKLTKNRVATARGLLVRNDQTHHRVDHKSFTIPDHQPIVETSINHLDGVV